MGSQRALARALGISAAAVSQWGSTDSSARGVPPKQCVRIEQLTCGRVGRKDLRPHDWRDIWPELAESEEKPTPAPASQAQAAINSEARQQAQGGV